MHGMPLEIIGAGFGRTGTMGLKQALEQLGFGPCYHMLEVSNHPEHIPMWIQATRGEAVDWESLFTGPRESFRSAVDWPASEFWPQLTQFYPNARVILTHRDPELWYASMSRTIFQRLTQTTPPNPRSVMARELILERVFGGRHQDKAHVLDVYRANIERVRTEVPRDRLLEFDPAEGWPKLCAFLEVAIPDCEYPHVNTTEQYRKKAGLD
jgi:hypothetical protein